METKTELNYKETASLCMETLMEKYFRGHDSGSNVLFMIVTDGKKIDSACAGNGTNIINALCNCMSEDDELFHMVTEAVKTMAMYRLTKKLMNMDGLKDDNNDE